MTRHESDHTTAPHNAAYAVSQPATVHHAMPTSHARTPSNGKALDFSAQFKQKEAMRLQRISGRPTNGSKSAQSQMAMIQASIMQQNNMMMIQMMSQQQQRYAGNQMAWGQQQHVPTPGSEVCVNSLLCCAAVVALYTQAFL